MTTTRKPAVKPTFYGVVINGDDIFIAAARTTEEGARTLAARTGTVAGVVVAGGMTEARDKATTLLKASARKALAKKAVASNGAKPLFFAVGVDEAGSAVAYSVGYKRSEWALDGAQHDIPTVTGVVAVQALTSADALSIYVALADDSLPGSLPANGVVKASGKAPATPRTPKAPKVATKVIGHGAKDSTDGRYFVAASGALHASATCHLVKPDMLAVSDPSNTLSARTFQAWADGGVAIPVTTDNGTETAIKLACHYCASARITVQTLTGGITPTTTTTSRTIKLHS